MKVPVHAKLTKLRPDTTYYFQLQAKNGKGTNKNGAVLHFTTPGPGILEASASKVASTSATLDATLEPHGTATSCYFQYVDEERYDATAADPYAAGTSIPVTPEAIGSTPGEVNVSQHLQGLSAGKTYYYRVVTVAGEEFDGEGHSFTTQGAGEFALPDHRQYEMVSPPDKDGALLNGIGRPVVQRRCDPSCRGRRRDHVCRELPDRTGARGVRQRKRRSSPAVPRLAGHA